MSEQNNYRIALNHKSRETEEWEGWKNSDYWRETADTWQDAIRECLDDTAEEEEYTVVAETPSEDGQSGIIEIQFYQPSDFYAGVKIKATLIET